VNGGGPDGDDEAGAADAPGAAAVDPVAELWRWYEEAVAAGEPEPEAMALATATPDGRPSVRYVLLRGASGGGLRFFTNYDSRKGDELAANPRAAVAFLWRKLGRQARAEGHIERLDAPESDAYFAARPRAHQLGAWASPQSRPIAYADLLARHAALERQHAGGAPVPRPPHWGGFRLIPDRVELWRGRPSRLHERLLYTLEDGVWRVASLGP